MDEFEWVLLTIATGLLGTMAVALCLHRWRWGVLLYVALHFFEDALRKILPGQPLAVLLFKDAALLIVLFSYTWGHAVRLAMVGAGGNIRFLFILWALWSVAAALLGPAEPLVVMAVLRSNLLYVVLFFLGAHLFEQQEQLTRAFRAVSLLAIPLFSVALLQSIMGTDGIRDVFPGPVSALLLPGSGAHEYHTHYYGKIPLTSSLFMSSERFARHTLVLVCVVLGVIGTSPTRFGSALALALGIGGLLLAGRRFPLFFAVVGTGSILLFPHAKRFLKSAVLRRGWGPAVAASVAICTYALITTERGPTTRSSFYSHGVLEVVPRSIDLTMDIVRMATGAPAFGYGLGTMGQERHFGSTGLHEAMVSDSGIAKLLGEGGVIYLTIAALLFASAIRISLRSARDCLSKEGRQVCRAILLLQIGTIAWSVKAHTVLSDASLMGPFWLLTGIAWSCPLIHADSRQDVRT